MRRGIEVLSAASYHQDSNWLYQEKQETKWTPEENKRFENALAYYDKDTPDRWLKVAAMIPGKTVSDVIKQYQELEEDVSDIEAGLIPVPGYGNNCFTLEWVSDHGFDGLKQMYCPGGKRGASNRMTDQERRKGVLWTEEEHRLFLMGLKKYGKGDWRNISRYFVKTRTPTQVASHAQKYFMRQHTGGKDKRRSSIHDITTVHIPDSNPPSPQDKTPSPGSSITAMKPEPELLPQDQNVKMALMSSDLLTWKKSNEAAAIFYDQSKGYSRPYRGISPYGPKVQEQNFLSGNPYASQFGPFSPYLQMQSMYHM